MSTPLEPIDANERLAPLGIPVKDSPDGDILEAAAANFTENRKKTGPPFGEEGEKAGWRVQTYVVPNTYPRSVQGSTRRKGSVFHPDIPDTWDVDRDAALDLGTKMIEEQGRQHAEKGGPEKDGEQLFTFVNRYFNVNHGPDTEAYKHGRTLLLAIPSNFTKEIFESYLKELVPQLGPEFVYDIWVYEFHNQGDSLYFLNKDVIGPRLAWQDISRDILQFVLRYLPYKDVPPANKTIEVLQPQDLKRKDAFKNPGRRNVRTRHIFAIGHSLGAIGLSAAIATVPEAFVGGIAFDPAMGAWDGLILSGVPLIMTMSLQRKCVWPSREAARSEMSKRGFVQEWPPDVIENYLVNSFVETPSGKTVIKQDRYQDAMCFLEVGGYAAASLKSFFERMHVADTVTMPRVHLILAEEQLSFAEKDRIEAWGHAWHVQPFHIEGVGHVLVEIAPLETAKRSAPLIIEAFDAYKL